MVKMMINNVERYFDGYTISNLDMLKEMVRLKWDGVLLYGGYEGDGKTTKCSQDMSYLDSTFDLSRVCFSVKELGHLMDTLPPGSAIMYDESWKDASNSNRYGSHQREFIRMLTEKRKKRLYIGIVCATFFDMNKYFVIHRARAYIHIYTDGLQRGFFGFYNRDKKQELYIKGKREWDLKVVQPSFRGRFTDWLPFDSEEYEAKKDRMTKENPEEEVKVFNDDREKRYREGQLDILVFFSDGNWLKPGAKKAVAEHLQVIDKSVTRMIKRTKEQTVVDSAVTTPYSRQNLRLKTPVGEVLEDWKEPIINDEGVIDEED